MLIFCQRRELWQATESGMQMRHLKHVQCYQIFTTHAMVNYQTVSLVYFILQNKSEEQYIRAFRQL